MIRDFLTKHSNLEPVSFHMPGHKGQHIYTDNGYADFFANIADKDITEIPGADNLFQTEGIIRSTMEKYSRLYRSIKSYLLINGTSGGLIASMMAAVPRGGSIIMARNCHKSVFNGLVLGNIKPIYAYPEIIEEYGLLGAVAPEEISRLMDENPEASAVILPSPNYYGICSDIKAIADIVHQRDKVLIVDQAHGAHLEFMTQYAPDSSLPQSAEAQGADLVVNSTHKTLASFTQSAVLNLMSERIEQIILEDMLQMIQSTSPSYILMATLDINADIIEEAGCRIFPQWIHDIDTTLEQLTNIPAVRIMNTGADMDRTKINIDFAGCGISGSEAENMLMKQGVFVELVTGSIVMCMSGIGNRKEDYKRLVQAVQLISSECQAHTANRSDDTLSSSKKNGSQEASGSRLWLRRRELRAVPIVKMACSLRDSIGKICASSIIPYPPGIPLVCPGEIIDSETIEYIELLRAQGEKVIGVSENGCVTVGKENIL